MTTKQQLDKQLDELDKQLVDLFETAKAQNKAELSSRQLLWKSLVDAYFWWREASLKKDYLDEIYKREGIRWNNKQENQTDFTPLVKLVFKYQQRLDPPTLLKRRLAINAIDNEFALNPKIYSPRQNPSQALVNWIEEKGGIDGITAKQTAEIEQDGYDTPNAGVKPASKTAKTAKPSLVQRLKDNVVALKKRHVATTETHHKPAVDVGPVGTDDKDFVVMLARATGDDDRLQVIGSTAQQAVVDAAVNEIVELTAATDTLRLLTDAVKINTVPKQLAKQQLFQRNNFYDKVKKYKDLNFTKYETTRLVIRKDGRILVSKTGAKSSVVTSINPKTIKFETDKDLFLRGSDRYWLETEVASEGIIALFQPEPNEGLAEQKSKKIKAAKKILLKNKLDKSERNLYFYDFSRVIEGYDTQPGYDFQSMKEIQDWAIRTNARFINSFYQQHFDGWMERIKGRVQIEPNKTSALIIDKDGIFVEKKWDKDLKEYTQKGLRYFTGFGNDGELRLGTGGERFNFVTTDIIATLQTIAAGAEGDVWINGNDKIIRINWHNELAEYAVWIPAASTRGKRDATHFKRYEPQ